MKTTKNKGLPYISYMGAQLDSYSCYTAILVNSQWFCSFPKWDQRDANNEFKSSNWLKKGFALIENKQTNKQTD